MKLVTFIDEDGFKHRSLIREGDDPALGVRSDPPDLSLIDWEEVKKTLHNTLVERGIITWQDIVRSQNGLSSAVLLALRNPLRELYREQHFSQQGTK